MTIKMIICGYFIKYNYMKDVYLREMYNLWLLWKKPII